MTSTENFYDATVAFLHIPKCAGQSILAAFQELYPSGDSARYYPPDDITRQHGQPRFISGHFIHGYQHTLSRSVRSITILRHPVARLKSQLLFDRDVFYSDFGQRYPEIAGVFASTTDAYEIMGTTKLWTYDNCIVRMLSGVGNTVPYGHLSNAHVEMAKRNLEAYEIVGFADAIGAFGQAVKAMCAYDYFNIPVVNTAKARNTDTSVLSFDDALLEDTSRFDMHLWFWAREEFRQFTVER
jgi:hypothetical protein